MSVFTVFPFPPKVDAEQETRKECPYCSEKLEEKSDIGRRPTWNERFWGKWKHSSPPYTNRQLTCMGISLGIAAGGFWIFYGFIILAIISPPSALSTTDHPGSLYEQAKILRAVPAILISALIPSFPLIYASILLSCSNRRTAFGLFVFAQFLMLIIVPILMVYQLKSDLLPYEKQFCGNTVNELARGTSQVANHLQQIFSNHTNAQPVLKQCVRKDFISHLNDSLIFESYQSKWKLYDMCEKVLKSRFEISGDL